MARCRSCGHENREGARFCRGCGAKLAAICPSCGAEQEEDASFCDRCGASLTEAPPPARTPTPPSAPALPTSFASGRYQVQRFLGEGGKKRVYLARDTKLDSDIAIALIKTEGLDAEGLTRIRREAQAMGRLRDHPHIVTILDIGDEAGQPYIVQEFMEGGSLEDLLREADNHRLPLDQTLRIIEQVCQALEHAHGRGIVHRDLKPGNIWLTQASSASSGQAQTAKLGDFGLAVAMDRSRLTQAGMMLGTVAYMPPEFAVGGGREAGASTDLYSLGAMLYEMVTGRPPFLGDDAVAIISQHINTAPVAPSWHNPDVPRALEALIMRLLAKAPEERPESAAAVREALTAIASTASTVAERVVQEEANPLDRLAGGVFVGREREMDELRAGLEDALSGRGRLMMLVGEPGIGKTRTADEFATYARLRNAQVLWGRCYEGEGAPAYWPWVQLIRSYVHERDPQALRSEMGPGAADIAEVVSEVQEALPGLPEAPALEPEQARFRLFDSITTFLKNAAKRQPIALVLDDLHWADKPSLLLLQFLARELHGARLLVLGTYRDVELRRQHPLSQTLGELNREQLSHRVLLRGLTEHDVARFIELTAGLTPPEALVAAVFRETEGLPLFVNEIVRLLVSEGRLERPEEVDSWTVTIPQGMKEVIGRRLDHLSEECNGVLTIAAVIGREFGLDALERVGDLSGDRLLEVLEEAVAARVLLEVPGAIGRYSFHHAYIRETLYEELSATRRVRLHQRIADELEAMYGDRADEHAAMLAYHYGQAAAVAGPEKLVRYATAAGRRAARQYAHEEAVRHFQSALSAREGQELDDETADLLYRLGRSLLSTLDVREAWRSLRQAFTYYAETGNVARAVDAAEVAGSTVAFLRPTQTQLLERGLELVESESNEERRLLACLGFSAGMLGDYERAGEAFQRAWAIASREGDRRAELRILRFQAVVEQFHGREQEALEKYLRVIELSEELDDPISGANAHFMVAGFRGSRGDVEGGRLHSDASRELAERLRDTYGIASATVTQASSAELAGDWEAALGFVQRGLEVSPRDPRVLARGLRAELQQGNFTEAKAYRDRLLDVMRSTPPGPSLEYAIPAVDLTFAALVTGTLEDLDVAEQAAQVVLSSPMQTPAVASMVRTGLALRAVLTGDGDAAAQIYASRESSPSRVLGSMSTDRLLGLLALTMGRVDEAIAHFDEGLNFLRQVYPPNYAWAAYDCAGALLQREAEGDHERAAQLLDESLAIARELGMRPLMERVVAKKLELQGIDPASIQSSIGFVTAAVQSERPDLGSHAAPDGTVTLLFTDIEDSTAMAERLGDERWLTIIRAHNAIIRENVEAHGGAEVANRGDGFMVAFQSPRAGIDCAVAIQKAFADYNHDRSEEPIGVRIGVHTGEPARDEDTFYGTDVNLTARIADDVAQGGEIVVSARLKELLTGEDIRLDEGRAVSVQGLSGKHRVFAVVWE